MDQLDLDVLFLMLLRSPQDQVKNKDMHILIMKIAKKLKEHMEAEENTKVTEDMGLEEIAKHEAEEERKEEQERKEEKQDKGGEDERKEEQENKEKEKGRREDERNKEEEEENQKGDERKERENEDKEGEETDDDHSNKEDNDDKEEDDEDGDEEPPIFLHEDQYAQILQEVFQNTSSSKPLQGQHQDRSMVNQTTKNMTTALDEEQIKQMIQEAKQEIVRELHETKPNKNQATGEASIQSQNKKVSSEEIAQKIEEIKQKLKEQLNIKGIVDKIKHELEEDCPLFILKVDEMMDASKWEEIRKALSLLECSADALIFTTKESIEQAKGYCYPQREPIDYSLVGLYHDTVLELTRQKEIEENYNPQLFRSILEECVPHEFCMKIFTHALCANPKRSNEELIKLHSTLKDSSKSFGAIAKKMFMYSYNDLPKEYKSCLLYLAIFPKGPKIRRSTLIERWIAEGLIVKEDWPSSVRRVNRCFDALIQRWLVYPADIGSTGKVKSCVIGDIVHGFITIIARKQHLVETRLSQHLARHFSIFNDLQLRSSNTIEDFFQGLSKSSRVSMLKVLDLEGCNKCFGEKQQRYLKDICSKMLLLKYLCLRGTDITHLPSEINLLRELEVLDIRQTKVPEYATRNILLLKLKRLLAGHIDPSPSSVDNSPSPSNLGTSSGPSNCQFWQSFRKNIDPSPSNFVQIPRRVDKMLNIEVLSNVKVRRSDDFKNIGNLWQLRKLGVAIKDNDLHLKLLLQTISDLHECLCSLSITTLPEATPQEGTPSSQELPASIASRLQIYPKILESPSIIGTTLTGRLLPVITNGGNSKVPKVTLARTLLNQDDLKILANLPELQCVRFRYVQCNEPMFTFKEDEFRCLEYLLVEGSGLTNITFEDGAARELKKMVLSFTSSGSISGVDRLLKLKELELNNRFSGKLLSSFDNAKQIAKLTLRGTLLEQDALQILAKKPTIRCLVLLEKSLHETQNQITFKKNEFPWLNHLIVDCSSITKIVFTRGSAPRLEKIVWSSFKSLPGIEFLSGIDKLPRLKEFNSDPFPKEVK